MKLHKRFILDIWKSAAYYDFQNSFRVPDTFYLHEKRIDWIFTGKSGKILKKKQENSTVNIVKEYFCNIEKNEQENELNNSALASQLLASYDEGICYFHYLDLSSVCELLVDSFKKRSEDDYENDKDIDFTAPTMQQRTESNMNQNELSDKTSMIQRFQTNSYNEKNMIRIEWNLNGKFIAQKRISNYESFRKEDEYKSYIIFEDENMSVNRDINMKDKEDLYQIAQHVVKAMELIHNERGKVNKLSLLLTSINNTFYLLACTALQFSNDMNLPQPWRISYELKMKYPNEAIHMQNALQDAENYLKKVENTKKVQQCDCCKNFSTKLQEISSTKLVQIRMRRGIGISQYEAKQLKKRDFSEICEVCYQIFLEIHKINSHATNQSNTITENSFISKPSVTILNSHRSSSSRQKRSQSNYESGGRQIQSQNNDHNTSQNASYNIQNYTSINSKSSNSRINNSREYLSNNPRDYSSKNLKDYSSSHIQGDQSTQHTREYSSNNLRDSSSQRSSQRMPPLSFRITEKVKPNSLSGSKQNIYSTNQSTSINTKLSQRTLNLLNNDISNQQLFIDLPESKKSIQLTSDILSNPYDLSENSQVIYNQEQKQPASSKHTYLKTREQEYQSVPINSKLSEIKESPIKMRQVPSEKKLISANQSKEREVKQPETQTKTIKGKFGIKLALKNLKKDVKKQQEEIKSVIQEALNDCQQISLKCDSQPSENRRYSKTNIKRITPRNSQELEVYKIQPQPSTNQIRNSQELLPQQKQLPPRSKNSSQSNRTGVSNQSTTNQSFNSNPYVNSSLESASLKVISTVPKQNNNFEPEKYLNQLSAYQDTHSNDLQVRNEQRLYSQDTIFSQRFRKNSIEQESRSMVYQNSNEIIDYGEPQKTIHNESQERLDTQKLGNTSISQEFLQNKDTFLDNLQDNDQQQITLFRVRRSQSFKK